MSFPNRRLLYLLATASGLGGLLLTATVAEAANGPRVVDAFDAGGLEARSAALILSGQEGGALQVAALALPLAPRDVQEAGEDISPVLVLVEIDGESLLVVPGEEPPRDAEEILTEVHAYALRDDGGLVAYFTQAFTFEPGLVARPGWAGVRFAGRLEVPPGRYTLRLLVLRRATDRLALKAVPFHVPDAGEIAVFPPLFPTPAEAWLSVRMAGVEAAEPLLAASPRPVIDPEWAQPFFLAGRFPPGSVSPGDLSLRILNEPSGQELRHLELAALQPSPEATVWSIFESGLGATDLPPGTYHVELIHPASGALAGLPVVVARHPEEVLTGPDVWTAYLGEPEVLAAPMKIPTLDMARRMRRMRKAEMEAFRDAYLDSLRHLIAGDASEARAAIVEIERSKIADGARERDIAHGQMLAAQMLVEEEPESLVPLIRLHLELYLDHLHRGDYLLATHSRRMMEVLLHLYLGASEASQAHRIAANALVGLGHRLLEVGNLLQARAIFDRALENRRDHPAALLGHVCIDEMLGELDVAVHHLRQLLRSHPMHPEGALRLAVNLERIDPPRPEEARQIYQRLVDDEETPDWIAVLAHEQLARAWAADHRVPEAIVLLKQGMERFSDQPRFYIQLAALHDQSGQLTEGRRVLAALDRRMARGDLRTTDSPRFLYTQWPEHAFAEAHRDFREIVSARLPQLAQALESFEPPGSSGGGS